MSEVNKNINEDIIEVPVTQVVNESQTTQTTEDILDLQDVKFMIMVGRKKNGEPFFRTSNVDDFFTIDGLISYAKRKVDHTTNQHFIEQDELERKKREEEEAKEKAKYNDAGK